MGKPTVPLYVVEAFTTGDNQAFTGNTAAVCLLNFDGDLSDEIKQNIAINMNLSETAFVTRGWKKGVKFNDPFRWTLRWFTPGTEVELCGHATLASASIIFNEILNENHSFETETSIVFESKFLGELGATVNWSTGLIRLDFPASPTVPMAVQKDPWLSDTINKTLGADLQPEVIKDIHYSEKGVRIIILELRNTNQGLSANEALLKKVKPDFQGLFDEKGQEALDHQAIIVTIKGSKDEGSPNFFSRCFAPWVGVDEDPVCGSAHAILAPFWTKAFQTEGVHLRTLIGVQSSKRGGKLICNLKDDRVLIAGSSRIVLKGNFIF